MIFNDHSYRDVKTALERNFDESSAIFAAFADPHHLFTRLTETLATLAPDVTPAAVLGVGCGTAASTAAILKLYPTASRVVAIDPSAAMRERALVRLPPKSLREVLRPPRPRRNSRPFRREADIATEHSPRRGSSLSSRICHNTLVTAAE